MQPNFNPTLSLITTSGVAVGVALVMPMLIGLVTNLNLVKVVLLGIFL